MEMLSTIEINDRNKADFERFRNLDECRTDTYTTVTHTAVHKDYGDECFDTACFVCTLCGSDNEIQFPPGDLDYEDVCDFCHGKFSVEISDNYDAITVRAAQPLER
jgi:hypothetical protein